MQQSYQQQIQNQDSLLLSSHGLQICINIFQQYNLMRSNMLCGTMGFHRFGLPYSVIKYPSYKDLQRYQYSSCYKSCSIRINSPFQNSKLQLNYILRIIIACSQNMSTSEAMTFCQCSKQTIKTYFSYFRRMISYYVQSEYNQQTLGQFSPEIVQRDDREIEVEESLFTYLNSIEDNHESQVWILGIIERHTNRFITITLGNAKEKTDEKILPIFKRYVKTTQYNPTPIFTGNATCNNFLQGAGFRHIRIDHSQGFGAGTFTTNRVESLWSQLKRVGKFDRGINFDTIQEVLKEVDVCNWRVRSRNNAITDVLFQMLSRYFNETGSNFSD